MLVALVSVFHVPILTFVGELLVVEDPLQPVDAVVVKGVAGSHVPFAEVAEIYNKGLARQIILIEDRSVRIVALGIVPPLEPLMRRELSSRGVPDSALTVISGRFSSNWKSAHALAGWIEEHPGARVIAMSEQLSSRENAHVYAAVLGPAAAGRLLWNPYPDRRYDPTNWWRVRQGILCVFGNYVSLVHTYVFGEPTGVVEPWDPDKFERDLSKP
jgi:hypothetical protein